MCKQHDAIIFKRKAKGLYKGKDCRFLTIVSKKVKVRRAP